MSAEKAWKIIQRYRPGVVNGGCLDFGTFFCFSLIPIEYATNQDYVSGVMMDAVDKKTGKIFKYDITSDIDAYDKAKEITVSTVMDQLLK